MAEPEGILFVAEMTLKMLGDLSVRSMNINPLNAELNPIC
jgi:hypothetical protein